MHLEVPPSISDSIESEVRWYCRSNPAILERANGSIVIDSFGRKYIDFFAGAGALNYGHNHPVIADTLIGYLKKNGILHALDFHTSAKKEFLEAFLNSILIPRKLPYKIQFCGPTGANAVEAALKLARKITGRPTVYSFTGAYHGASLGALAVTSSRQMRDAAGTSLGNVAFVPFPAGPFAWIDSIKYLRTLLKESHSGTPRPAAIIFETVQAEGGVFIAPIEWIRELRQLCDEYEIILICDEIQTGCGRTGPFFSFERAGIVPDIVALSKSLSGSGLPMAVVLIRNDFDVWKPGDHNGTFRGNQLAFVGATAAIEVWHSASLEKRVGVLETRMRDAVSWICSEHSMGWETRGIGMLWGIDMSVTSPFVVGNLVKCCARNGLIIETTGSNGSVLKISPSLTISDSELDTGFDILNRSILEALESVEGTGAS